MHPSTSKFQSMKPNMYNTNIIIGSQKENAEEKKSKCDVLAVYMPDEDIQSQLVEKQSKSKECIDYRSYLPVYQPTTVPFNQDLQKRKQRKILLWVLFGAIFVLFMTIGGALGYGIYKGMMCD